MAADFADISTIIAPLTPGQADVAAMPWARTCLTGLSLADWARLALAVVQGVPV